MNDQFLNRITLGDCFDILPKLEPNSVDLIILDPPYNIGSDSKITFRGGEPISTNKAWSDNGFKDNFTDTELKIIIEKLAKEFSQLIKPEGSVFVFFDHSHLEKLTPFLEYFRVRNVLCFVKNNPSPQVRLNNYKSGFELCVWFTRSFTNNYKINFVHQYEMNNVFCGNIGTVKETTHPTEKYRWMMKPIILNHTNKGDLVLDPMCGSATSCVLSKELGRNFIGIEIKQEFYEMALKRVNSTTYYDDVPTFF